MRSRTLDQLRHLLNHLPRRRRSALWMLVPLSVVPGVIDLASVAVIARLTGSLVDSDLEDRLPGIHVFGGDSVNQSVWMILVFILLAWAASLSKISLKFFQQRLSAGVWRDISDEIHARLLQQPYEYHLGKSTADLSSQLLNNLNRVAMNVVTPILQILSASVSIVLLSIGILFVGRWLAVVLVVSLVLAYSVISGVVTPRLRHGFRQKLRQEAESASILFESLGSIRDIQLSGSEPYFERQFRVSGERARRYAWLTEWLPDLPRGLIEPFGITMIFAVGAMPALMSGNPNEVRSILPFLATIAVAALRLTPPLQDAFRSLTQLRGGLPLLDGALALLDLPADRPTQRTPGVPSAAGVFPRNTIRLDDVWYRYPHSDDWVLKGVNLSIPVGSRIALVGSTGSGKTTTANILLGLLHPSRGALDLDGIPVEGLDIPAWQANCAQVPQSINLLNGSVLENVAFGEAVEQVKSDRVWEALEAAQLEEFVAELPYGLHTQIGENGLRLSGGQRQRLALARAFYRQASFLVLDEATSALDNRTESEVIEALEVIGRRCTTVVIAHRLSTVQRCDRIYEFQNGSIKAYGSYAELKERSDSFRELAMLEQQQAAS
ncbi:ABC transporter ATP-binding protein [Synechococcus sp. CB0205]|uniref:ABC transporter ATP-binding protein n=1 Tax=Synechococcus sp. CB0205 TaxID=232363 RepID=UPI00020024B0|nr:ABC transporter ATP-binding protein [Synechococcus sp. CB0205]